MFKAPHPDYNGALFRGRGRIMAELTYLRGYPEPLKAQVQQLIAAGKLGEMLAKLLPQTHLVQSDRRCSPIPWS